MRRLSRLLNQVSSFSALGCSLARSEAAAGSRQPLRGLQQQRWSHSQPFKGFAASAKPAAQGDGKAAGGDFSRWYKAFQSAPTYPKVLGLAGAIPFIALAPPVSKHLTGVLPADIVDNSAAIQVAYGVTIVTFLGAVHWGVAMSSSLAGPLAAKMANENYFYSVIPSLMAWPVALMEPDAGAIALTLLLPFCLAMDYRRRNFGFPHWYIALRLPLTLLASFGTLLTSTRRIHMELDRMNQLYEADKQASK